MNDDEREETRQLAREFDCPKCGVSAGTTCSRQDGEPRKRQHMERMRLYKAMYGVWPWERTRVDSRPHFARPAKPGKRGGLWGGGTGQGAD